MKRSAKLFLIVGALFCASPLFAQNSIPEIPYDSAANLLKLPDNIYLGEAVGVATNSKGHIFVYTRTGSPKVTIGTNRTFARSAARPITWRRRRQPYPDGATSAVVSSSSDRTTSRRLCGVGALPGLATLKGLLRVLGLLVLESLKHSDSPLCLVHTAKAAIDDSELIPGLLNHFGIGARCRRGALQMLGRGSVIADEHFGAA